MKITFENYNKNNGIDKTKTPSREAAAGKDAGGKAAGGFRIDLTGLAADNNAYGTQAKTKEDIMRDAGEIDVALQRKYMTVMSNSMSSEDFARLQEEGYSPGDVTVEEAVTILDHIKAEMAKSGNIVAGYTDDIPQEALEEVAGSQASAQEIAKQLKQADAAVTKENVEQVQEAVNLASGLNTPDDGCVKYMIQNQLEPTIENLYMAKYSGNTDPDRQGRGYYQETRGYYSRKAEDYDLEQLEPQIKKTLEQAGMECSEENLQGAKWLIEKGLPMTPENLEAYNELRSLQLPMSEEELLNRIVTAVADGKNAAAANLADGRSQLEKAEEYLAAVEGISDEAADLAAASGQEMTLSSLEAAQTRLDQGYVNESPVSVTARRQLEEIRLHMTLEANLKLLQSGFQIDTAPMEQLIEELKAIEAKQKQAMFGGMNAEETELREASYHETRNRIVEIPHLPAAVIGSIDLFAEDTTLDTVYQEGAARKRQHEAAGETYEKMRTSPRSDLGDTIQKAFKNTDSILNDLGMKTSEQNRRAVRILGYNKMEITEENIDAVKNADLSLNQVVRKMNPAVTMRMIRDGINPLELSIADLEHYLDHIQDKTERTEKYSKYLYKLEQNGSVSEEERSAYIGIYRFFRQLEKTDGAAVGTIVNAGEELSFKNLLTALRSTKKVGMDYTVDDSFGTLENLIQEDKSISRQIETAFSRQRQPGSEHKQRYYEKLVSRVLDQLDPDKLSGCKINGDVTLEQFSSELENAKADKDLENAYLQDQVNSAREANKVDDTVVEYLLDSGQAVTVDNLLSARSWLKESGSTFRKLERLSRRLSAQNESDRMEGRFEEVAEAFTDKETAQKGYGEFISDMQKELEQLTDSSKVSSIDLRSINSIHKQLNLAGSFAKEEDYQIPLKIGEEITAVRLKVIYGSGETGKVKITLDTEQYGSMEAEFKVNGKAISGFIAAEKADSADEMKKLGSRLNESLAKENMPLDGLTIVYGEKLYHVKFMKEKSAEDSSISSGQLYKAAKAFIRAVK